MIIVGFDPGLATLGYGAIEKNARGQCRMLDFGVVLTPKDENLAVRLCMLEEGVKKVIHSFQPDEIAVEELFFAKNITTGIPVAHARGVILLTAAKECGRLYEYTPMQIKQAVTGYGKADKHQVQNMVKLLLNMREIAKPDDAADALAVAITHANSANMKNLYKIQ